MKQVTEYKENYMDRCEVKFQFCIQYILYLVFIRKHYKLRILSIDTKKIRRRI